jgi:rhodanese-related sulfurtransferase
MKRRTALKALGVAVVGGLAGCSGGPQAANEYGYETTTTDGVAVPLVPIADAIQWYNDDAALFADARGRRQFETSHIAGAVFSPAPDGQGGSDPVEQRETDAQIVTYCRCPHHLSSLRAASLISDGYANTYALDEGFGAWLQNNYPVEGTNPYALPTEYRIAGRTDPAHAGAFAWARHRETGQREPAPIAEDGTFAISFRFYDVDADSSIEVETPEETVTRPLGQLREGVVEV